MDDSINPRARAIAALAEMFLDLAFGSEDFAAIESKAIDLGHGCMAERAPSPPRSATSPSPSGAVFGNRKVDTWGC